MSWGVEVNSTTLISGVRVDELETHMHEYEREVEILKQRLLAMIVCAPYHLEEGLTWPEHCVTEFNRLWDDLEEEIARRNKLQLAVDNISCCTNY